MLRLPQLDGLRGLTAVYVVLHHAWLTIWPARNGVIGFDAPLVTGVLAYGHFAVAVFIVLSGFCLGAPLARNGWRLRGGAVGFLRRRARRILPPYYAAVAFSLLLIATRIGGETGSHWDISVPVDATGLAASLLLVQNVLGQSQINHVFWSIAVEAQIYVLFPLLVLVAARRGARAAVLVAAVATGALLLVVGALPVVGPLVLAGLTPQFLLLFAIGMGAAAVAARGRGGHWGRWALLGLALLAVLCAVLGREGMLTNLVWLDVLAGLATASALIALCTKPQTRTARVLAVRPLAGLGLFAYSIYLVHAPVLQLVWLEWIAPLGLEDGTDFLLLLAAGVPVALAVSYGFFLVFERPFLGRPRRAEPGGAGALAARSYS